MVGGKMRAKIKEFIIECMLEALRRFHRTKVEEINPLEEEKDTEDTEFEEGVLIEWLYGGENEQDNNMGRI